MPIQLSGSLVITGSITTTGVITMSGSIASASYSSTSDLLQGTGSVGFATTASFNAVSSSQQQISASYIALSASYNVFSGSASTRITANSSSIQQVSSSQQQISSSLLNVISIFATTGSNSFRANQSITGSLVVSSTITAQTLVVQTVTSSIVYSSGSNLFGNQLANTQTFTGSVNITGSLALAGRLLIGTTDDLTNALQVKGDGVFANRTNSAVTSTSILSISTGGTYGTTAAPKYLDLVFSGDNKQIAKIRSVDETGNIDGGYLMFYTSTAAGTVNQNMILHRGGNLNIGTSGTTDAGYKLDVNGTGRFSGALTVSGNLNLQGAVTRNINFYDSSNTNINAQIQYDQISSTSGQLFFGTNNAGTFATRLTIANTGAATFSSNLQAQSLTVNTADQYLQMNGYNGATTQFISNAGYSSAYNGLQITSNSNNANSLPAWSIDLGGYDSNFSNNDQFNLGRKPSGGNFTKFLTIANTGAATFSSSVTATAITATGLLYGNGGESDTLYTGAFFWTPGSYNFFNQKTDHSLVIGTYNANSPIAAVTIAQSGATTFASSVTATGYTFTGTGAVIQSNGSVGNVPQYGLFYNSGGVFYFGKDDGSGGSFGVGAYATVLWNSGAYPIVFTTSGAERMRILADNTVCFGKTVYDNTTTGVSIADTKSTAIVSVVTDSGVSFLANRKSSTGQMFLFRYNGTNIGDISTNGTTTSYNTTSDYRLKEDFKDVKGLEKILAIKIYDFKYKNSENRMDGVLAHELEEIIPYAINGEKDAIDKDDKIIAQGVDYSKIVPVLVKAIQELSAKVTALEKK